MAGSVMPVGRGWVQGELGALIPRPWGAWPPRTRRAAAWPSRSCNRSWEGSWVGAERGAGAAADAWVLWESWLQLPVSICTPGTAHPAPCLSFPTRIHAPTAYRCQIPGAFPALAPSSRLWLFGCYRGLSKGKGDLGFGVTRSDRGINQCAPWHKLPMAPCFCCCWGVAWGSTVPAWPYWGARESLHCGSPWVLPGCPAGAASASWSGGCGGIAVLVGALYPRVGVILRVRGRWVLRIHAPAHLGGCTCVHPRVRPSARPPMPVHVLYLRLHLHPCRCVRTPGPMLVWVGAPT